MQVQSHLLPFRYNLYPVRPPSDLDSDTYVELKKKRDTFGKEKNLFLFERYIRAKIAQLEDTERHPCSTERRTSRSQQGYDNLVHQILVERSLFPIPKTFAQRNTIYETHQLFCCYLREATSAALPYARRAGFRAVPASTTGMPVQVYSRRCFEQRRLPSDATSSRFQSMWLLLSENVCELVCPGPH